MGNKKLYFFKLEWVSCEMNEMGTGRVNKRNERLVILLELNGTAI